MKLSKIYVTLLCGLFSVSSICQKSSNTDEANHKDEVIDYRFAVFTPWLSFSNFGKPETNTHHYEILARYQITAKDAVGIKAATWELFAPMGIPIWDPLFLKESAYYPGRLRESGVGITYQRRISKKLFVAIEILPLFTTYLDESDNELSKGFKLYKTYHIGYHIPLFRKGRFFIEPQIHLNHWTVNTNRPESFETEEDRWNNFFFFEPNLYFGYKF